MSVCLDIFLKTFFMYGRPIPVQIEVHLINLQFLAVTYAMGVLSCAFDLVNTVVCFFLCLSNFLELKWLAVKQSL